MIITDPLILDLIEIMITMLWLPLVFAHATAVLLAIYLFILIVWRNTLRRTL